MLSPLYLSNINISGIVDGSYTVGSLAGVSVSCEIDDCSCSVTVFGGSYTGGLIGRNSYSELYNSFFIGNVTGIVSTGGFIGEPPILIPLTSRTFWEVLNLNIA